MSQQTGGFDPYLVWLGIPSHERPINYYRLLGVPLFEENPQVIEAAANRQVASLQGETGGLYGTYAEQLIEQILQARLTLLDPVRKQAYDQALKEYLKSRASFSATPQPVTDQRASTSIQTPVALPTIQVRDESSYRTRPKKQKLSPEWIAALVALGVTMVGAAGLIVWLTLSPSRSQDEIAHRSKLQRGQDTVLPQRDGGAQPAEARLKVNRDQANRGVPAEGMLRGAPAPLPGIDNEAEPDEVLGRDMLVRGGDQNGVEANAERDIQPAQAGKLPWLKKVQSATVIVEGETKLGSGFFVRSAWGKKYVVTNAHVVSENWDLRIKLASGQQISINKGQILPEYDLAILDVEGLNLPEPLELRKELPDVGETVYAYGAPGGLVGSLTEGIVSAVRTTDEIREVAADASFDDPVRKADAQWIQSSASVSPGNSGGPLLDSEGRVVGMNTGGFNSQLTQNLNFALASPEIEKHVRAPILAALPRMPPPGAADRAFGMLGAAVPLPGQDSGRDGPSRSFPFETYSCPDVVLPSSGAVFQAGKVRPPANWLKIVLEAAVVICSRGDFELKLDVKSRIGFYVVFDDNENLQFAAGFYKGLLEGPLVLFNEGVPYVMANYRQGSRHGPFVVYNEQAQPSLLVEFVRGRKQGLVCVFDQQPPYWPRYVETWQADRVMESCFVTWDGGKPTTRLVASITEAEELTIVREHSAFVTSELGKIEDLERAIKREVNEVFRQLDLAIKRGRAAAFSAEARDAILARHAEREAAGAAVRAAAMAKFRSGL